MISHFAQVLALLFVGAIFIFGALFAGKFLRPKNPSRVKGEIYECGEPPVGSAWINFNIRFYLIALVFVIFDVEAALIFPVAAVFRNWVMSGKGFLAMAEIAVFVLILAVGLVYALAKNDLKWLKEDRA